MRFRKEGQRHQNHPPKNPPARVPGVARLLALAHRIDGMIRSGEVKDWAEAALLVGVTRARMTQISNLLLLAPEIQHQVLSISSFPVSHKPIPERDLRLFSSSVVWEEQDRKSWTSLSTRGLIIGQRFCVDL
jgi:hypothetical protein